MANTYTQIHIHCVFAVQNRLSLINERWEDELHKYITGIISNNGHKLLQIGGTNDHIHVLLGMRPMQSISDLMQDIKSGSALWINKNGYAMGKFRWQESYGAFSNGKSQIHLIVNYIKNQKKKHLKKTFQEEYIEILNSFGVEFDMKYIMRNP